MQRILDNAAKKNRVSSRALLLSSSWVFAAMDDEQAKGYRLEEESRKFGHAIHSGH